MNLSWKGKEEIAAPKAAVWAFVNDPQKIASCLPDLVSYEVRDPQHFDAVVKVGIGPVKGQFKFKISLDPKPDGNHVDMRISGGGLGSVVDLVAGADIKDNGNATTTLDWTATAEMRGPIASVGGRVIGAQAERVISTTFANVKKLCASLTV